MRWIALLLLLANVALFWWLSSSGGDKVRSVEEGKLPRVAEIQLIDEQAGREERDEGTPTSLSGISTEPLINSEPGEDDSLAEVNPGPEKPAPPVPACFGIGWFDDEATAHVYRRNLLDAHPSLGFRGLRERTEELEPFHWVIIPPLPSRDEAVAMHRELVSAGIEAYVVPSGERENAISLGLFRSLESAERILSQRQAENIDATLVKFPRNRISYALVFEGVPEPSLRDPGLPPAGSEAELQLVEFSDCEGVATAEKNP
ncbi:SPOR domain-containing protein [Marinobacter sp.]|uniref:SPOR domain-containing protein n=1 Tax=Marinobacter sp. TaxID=50741 RepID=UPI003561D785